MSTSRSRWHTCLTCGQKFFHYVDARMTGSDLYCSQRCEREATAARYTAIVGAFFGD